MSAVQPCIYFGTVTHRRLQPVVHELRYDVACVLVDVDRLGRSDLPPILSHNAVNLFSIHDCDHGNADGRSISDFAWGKLRETGRASDVNRIFMLCYPRVLGFGFNPITTYFCITATGETRMMIYEVRNTFGERQVYVVDAHAPAEPNYGRAAKRMRVSPFNKVEGDYGLRASEPGETVTIGVSLTVADAPVLKAYFAGKRKPLSTAQLLRIFFGLPFMSLKVILAIHWEALKLWKKGLRLQQP